MPRPDIALIAPFPALGRRHDGWTGVASYSANLAGALDAAGAGVTVLASVEEGEPAVGRDGSIEVRRVWRRGPTALPIAAAAARATGAPIVHLQHELFLYGGAAAGPALVPALAALRGRRSMVTMHHVVDPAAVDAEFARTHRVRAPALAARAAVVAVQRAIRAVAGTVIVHEPAFAAVIPGAEVIPHGVETPRAVDRAAARAALGVRDNRLCVLCFGFVAPYKGLEVALGAARLAVDAIELVIAGGDHPRLAAATDPYADRLRAGAPGNARFTGFVPEPVVARWFAAADVALLPYPRPFASSGALALALAHGTPPLLSSALARTTGAPPELAVDADPAAVAARLRELAEQPSRRAALRESALAMAAGRAWPEVARRHLELYELASGADGPSGPSRVRRSGRVTAVTAPAELRADGRRPVLLVGAFGQGNVGDEALLTAFVRALPSHPLIVASSAPLDTTAVHRMEAVGRDDLVGLARCMARANAVVVAGGTVFKTLHPSTGRRPLDLLLRLVALMLAAKAMRKPVALVGVGVGALDHRGARRLTRAAVRAADLLVLRDDESAARLAAAGARPPFRVGADPAWTLLAPRTDGVPLAEASPNGAGERPVIVALSHLAGGKDLADWLAAGLGPVLAAGVRLRLLPWQLRDGALAAALAARLGGAVELMGPPADLVAARDALAGARLVVGLRLHALVAAAATAVPFVAYAHEPKLEGVARRLEQPAVARSAPASALTAAILGALDRPAPSAAALRRERARAEEGFRLLRVLLARGRTEEAADLDGLALRPEEWLG
jgi:polysaccharide pyruvyl transferase WcaK-like protein/glycosyltransferase involved in cell wall biosynthesis